MATTIQAVTRYRARLISKRTIGLDKLGAWMENSSLVNTSVFKHVLDALFRALVRALLRGDAVLLPGFLHFSLELRSDGQMHVVVRPGKRLHRAVNRLPEYEGTIRNRDNIGCSATELVALWNADHPDDPVLDAT